MESELISLFEHKLVMMQEEKTFNSLPNEMMRSIFDKVDMIELIAVRGVCTRWLAMIEDICREKRSLLIVELPITIAELSHRFNHLVDLRKNCAFLFYTSTRFDVIKLRISPYYAENPQHKSFYILLAKLFPKVENFVLSSSICRIDATRNVFILLDQWSSTLVNLFLPPTYHFSDEFALSDQIDKLTALKRLYYRNVCHHRPTTLARLEHCSLSSEYDMLDKVPLLGPNCTSLYLKGFASLCRMRQLPKLNAQLVSNLTRLRIIPLDIGVLQWICENLDSLQMLDVDFMHRYNYNDYLPSWISELVRLANLSQLTIRRFKFDWISLAGHNLSLNSVRTLSMVDVQVARGGFGQFDGDEFCRVVSSIFSHLHQLNIKHGEALVRQQISRHLDLFVNLRKHAIVSLD